ncbi:MAG: 8-amino-7-oxononanoate synthase [Planctomycetota bacterium]|nr:8-amino-7-oxononanoate synthase [Planctomycetota bacterium]
MRNGDGAKEPESGAIQHQCRMSGHPDAGPRRSPETPSLPEIWAAKLRERAEADARSGLARSLTVSCPIPSHRSFARIERDGRHVVSFASNDYLGLARDWRVIDAAAAAAREFGASASASRLLSGNLPIHAELESALASFKGAPACRVFSTGYLAAIGAIGALCGRGDEIVLDRLCHACLIDGALLSGARVRTFRHNDVAALAEAVGKGESPWKMVVVESVYSMDGDVAPLEEIYRICRESGALLLVDDAHGTGVLGDGGRGAAISSGAPEGWPGHLIVMGTLSKALASQGGYICGHPEIIEAMTRWARTFLFDTGLCPPAAGAAIEAVRIARTEPERRGRLLRNIGTFAGAAAGAGLRISAGPTHICPVMLGSESLATRVASMLLDKGFYIPAVRYPTVARGEARLRISITAAHSEDEVRAAARAVARALAEAAGR